MEAVIFEEFAALRPGLRAVSNRPEAAASLAQVHLEGLRGGGDADVRDSAARHRADRRTDLAAIRVAKSWLKVYGPIRRKADLESVDDVHHPGRHRAPSGQLPARTARAERWISHWPSLIRCPTRPSGVCQSLL